MSKNRLRIGLLTLLASSTCCLSQDVLTPLIASPLTSNTTVFQGSDAKQHVVYELVLTNTRSVPATLTSVEVVTAGPSPQIIAAFDGAGLLNRLHTLASKPAATPEIEFNGTRLFLIDFAFDAGSQIPNKLEHRLKLTASGPPGSGDTAIPLTYTVAPMPVVADLLDLAPPLAGKGWVAVNGCCEPAGVHRSTGLPVNGEVHFAQRYAIDWMQLDASGRLVHGDASDVHNYTCYGADILAVADGTVVGMLNGLDDQPPGTLPDPKTINLSNVDGNHIVLDLGRGRYAFYAHLQKDSLQVKMGEHVKRGQMLAKLGNTGNTSAPHLHFHIMDGASVLGSNGLPYTINHFDLSGHISETEFDKAPGVEGDWSKGLDPKPTQHHGQFPLDLAIVNF
jgi:hypothetical protein